MTNLPASYWSEFGRSGRRLRLRHPNWYVKEAYMAQVKFTPHSYFNAAQDHLGLAVRLREQGEHFTAHFFAGIAIECILRALSVREGEPFDGTHNIEDWAKKANLLPKGSEGKQDEFRAKLVEVNLR